ncbi:MAG: hypothetical protein NC113_04300 [Bacteroides sp.]|nr:hypothetical protein [Bacteroides sp.]MCM1447429.1 hypothetical protein [Bacteroides sp.]
MNKKKYICPTLQVIKLDITTPLLAGSKPDELSNLDKNGNDEVSNENGVFSRNNNTNLWDQLW